MQELNYRTTFSQYAVVPLDLSAKKKEQQFLFLKDSDISNLDLLLQKHSLKDTNNNFLNLNQSNRLHHFKLGLPSNKWR